MTPPRTSIARAVAAGAVGVLVVLGAAAVGTGVAVAQSTTTSADPADSTTTIDQSLTTTPPLDAENAPNYDNSPDLDMDRITGPRFEDGKVTTTTFWPLGIAAVAILAVFGSIFYRAARGNNGNQSKGPGRPKGAERGTPTSSSSSPSSD